MKLRQAVGLLAGIALAVTAAQAQTNVRVRGNIVAIDGKVLSVKSRDGKDRKIELADNLTVAVTTAIRFDDIKQGDYVGATTTAGPDGRHVAVEVHYLAPTVPEARAARAAVEGHLDALGVGQSRALALRWLMELHKGLPHSGPPPA